MTFRRKSSPLTPKAGPTIGLAVQAAPQELHMGHKAISTEINAFDARSLQATRAGAEAFARLLKLAEERDSGQIVRIARFLAASYNGECFPFDLFELRAVDITISDDMLSCLDALRWGRADLHTLIPDGDARVRAVIERWRLRWPDDA
jgi:hypothetical protein